MKKRLLAITLGISMVLTSAITDASFIFADEIVAEENVEIIEEIMEPEKDIEAEADVNDSEEVKASEVETAKETSPSKSVVTDDGVIFTLVEGGSGIYKDLYGVRVNFDDAARDEDDLDSEDGKFYSKRNYKLVIPSTITIDDEDYQISYISSIMDSSFENSEGKDELRYKEIEIQEGIKYLQSVSNCFKNIDAVKFPSTLEYINGNFVLDNIKSGPRYKTDKISFPKWYENYPNSEIIYAGSVVISIPEGIENVSFKEGTTQILPFAAYRNTDITKVDIPDSVKQIGAYSFAGCTSLSTFNIGKNSKLEEIGFAAFGYYEAIEGEYAGGKAYNLKDAVPGAPIKSIYLPLAVLNSASNSGYGPVGLFNGNINLETVTFGTDANDELVYKIPFRMFRDCSNLESFKLPAAVSSIENECFWGCTKLRTFTVPQDSKLGSLGYTCFGWTPYKIEYDKDYSYLTLKTAYDKYTDVAVASEYGAPIEEIYLPAKVFAMSNNGNNTALFAGNEALKKLTIGNADVAGSATGFLMFAGCSNLKEINGLGNIYTIAAGTFANCSNLENVNLEGKTKELKYQSFKGTGIKELVVPKNVTLIEQYALGNCASLKKLTINSLLESNRYSNNILYNILGIGQYGGRDSFNGSNIEGKHITCPQDFVQRHPQATALEELTINAVDGKNVIEEFYNANKSYDSTYQKSFCYAMPTLTKVILPENMQSIPDGAFAFNLSLKDINIPTSIEKIGKEAFYSTPHINVDFSKLTSLREIGASAFFLLSVDGGSYNGGNLTDTAERVSYGGIENIILPEGVTTIGANAFFGQRNVKKVVIPSSVTAINEHAFQFLNGLEELVFDAKHAINNGPQETVNGWNYIFWNNRSDSVKKITLGEHFIDTINGIIGNDLLYGIQAEEVVIEGSVKSVGDSAFGAMKNLKELPNMAMDAIEYIGAGAFQYCTSLIDVNLSETKIDTVKSHTFVGSSKIERIVLPDTVETIEKRAFEDTKALKKMVFGENVKNIEYNAFKGSGAENIYIYNDEIDIDLPVVSENCIRSNAGKNYKKLYTINEADTPEEINERLASFVAIPSNVTIYGNNPSNAKNYADNNTFVGEGNPFKLLNGGIQFIDIPRLTFKKRVKDADFNLNATAKTSITYTSSDESVVAVSDDGTVKIIGEGEAVISVVAKAEDDYLEANENVYIKVLPADKEDEGPKNPDDNNNSDNNNDNKPNTTIVKPIAVLAGNTYSIEGDKGSFSIPSSQKKLASVSKTGVVKAKKAGTITVSYTLNEKPMEITINIEAPKLVISKKEKLAIGEEVIVTLEGTTVDTAEWILKDSKTASIEVSKDKLSAKVKGLEPKNNKITVKVGKKKYNVAIKLAKPIVKVESKTIAAGSSIKAKISNVEGVDVSWSADTSGIVNITKGDNPTEVTITGIAPGKTKITATVNGKAYTVAVSVK